MHVTHSRNQPDMSKIRKAYKILYIMHVIIILLERTDENFQPLYGKTLS